MRKEHENNYVIKVEYSHPGNTEYKIISTLDGYREMLRKLSATIDGFDHRKAAEPQHKFSKLRIWGDYATLFPGKTSRIYLSLEVDESLAHYSKKPGFLKIFLRNLFSYVVLILAAVGFATALKWLF